MIVKKAPKPTVWYYSDGSIYKKNVVGELTEETAKQGDNTHNHSAITKMEIGEYVTSIGSWAFQSCTSLTSVTIPDSVTSIGNDAFYSCHSLTSITIPDSVTSVGESAFNSCSGLTSIVIGSGIIYMSKWMFRYCYGLTSVIIPDNVRRMNKMSFQSCSGLTSIVIGSGLLEIGVQDFYEAALSLTSITVDPNNVVYTSDGNCLMKRDGTVVLGCKNSVIPTTATIIGDYAFHSCSGLTSVVIPDGVTNIGQQAFYGCTSITSITIPDSVTSIGNNAFASCSGLNYITYSGTKSQWNTIFKEYRWKYSVPTTCKVHCTDGDIPIADA